MPITAPVSRPTSNVRPFIVARNNVVLCAESSVSHDPELVEAIKLRDEWLEQCHGLAGDLLELSQLAQHSLKCLEKSNHKVKRLEEIATQQAIRNSITVLDMSGKHRRKPSAVVRCN